MGVIKKKFKKIVAITLYIIAVIFTLVYFSDGHLDEVVKINNSLNTDQGIDSIENEQPDVLGSKLEVKQELSDDFSEDAQNSAVVKNEYYLVVKVVDGDTIDIDIDGTIERLRLIGMNTPETVDPRRPVECFGAEASKKAKELLTGQKVKIVNDDTQDDRDKYGRLLRYVFLKDSTFFNLWMIQNGYAHEYTYAVPYVYQADFKQAEIYAKENNLGLWDVSVCEHDSVVKVQSSTDEPEITITQSNQIFYTSSYHSAKLYYCDTDVAWKNLSSKYLEEFDNENDLLARYPNKTLHEPCR